MDMTCSCTFVELESVMVGGLLFGGGENCEVSLASQHVTAYIHGSVNYLYQYLK